MKKTFWMTTLIMFFIGGGIFLASSSSASLITAVDFEAPGESRTTGNWSLGFEFNVNEDILVDRLGFFDFEKNDLVESHLVGIWNPQGTLIVSGQVNPGDMLHSWWRWTSVNPTMLTIGDGYRIAAVTGTEIYTADPEGFTVNPSITYVTARATPTSGELIRPIGSYPDEIGFFGPNFASSLEIPPSPVPEPSTTFLLSISLLGLTLFGNRRRSKT